jgi:hypothetical protein
MTTTTQKSDISNTTAVLWFAGLIAAGLIFRGTHMVTTDIGFQTVLLHQPVLGAYEVMPKALKPGRSLEWFTVRGVPVKTDKMRFYERYAEYTPGIGEEPIQVELVVKTNDAADLVAQFGEFWYTDHVEEMLHQSVTNVAREYSREIQADSTVFQQDFNGRLKAVVQMKFKSKGVPLIVQSVDASYSNYPRTSTLRYNYKTHKNAKGQGVRMKNDD